MKIDLNSAGWHLTGVWPWAPVLGKSLETGGELRGLTPRIKAAVPGSVYRDLQEAGLIEDPYVRMNSLNCEWVESKWWNYDTQFPAPPVRAGERVFLCFDGLDYRARIYLNQTLLCIHEGMFLPLELEITDQLLPENTLSVLFEECPREMALGLTSQVHTQKARFGYKWDFGTRLVNVGIWDSVSLKVTGPARLRSPWVRTDCRGGTGEIRVQAEIEGECRAEVSLHSPEGKVLERRPVEVRDGELNTVLSVKKPKLWSCNGMGEQPLYRVVLRLFTGDLVSDEAELSAGIRSLSFVQNEGAPAGSLPYTVVLNGEKVYLKGVNLVPFDHLYGCVTARRYEEYLKLLKNCNVNLVRIWGGGLLEKEYFYRLCDENGILVWQEFIQSSSGVENVPPTDEAFLKLLEKTARQAVRSRRGHVSLTIWCGGNELRERPDADTPVTTANPNIALLERIVAELDGQRLFLPSCASGPFEFVTEGPGHDVHGLWRYDGPETHYPLYNKADYLLHSEFGADGMSSLSAIQAITGLKDPPIEDTESSLVWRFHGEWWDNVAQNRALFGAFESLEQLIDCSQLMQAEGVRYIVEEGRRKAFHNSGTIVWQFNEPWPNVSCTNLVEYSGRPKGAYYFVRRAYSPVALSLRYQTLTPKPGRHYRYEVWLSAFQEAACEAGYELLDSRGGCLATERLQVEAKNRTTRPLFSLELETPETKDRLFFLRLFLKKDGRRIFENTYFFSSGSKTPLAPLLACQSQLEQQLEGETVRLTNRGDRVALYVSPEGETVFEDCWTCLFPGETRTFRRLTGSGASEWKGICAGRAVHAADR